MLTRIISHLVLLGALLVFSGCTGSEDSIPSDKVFSRSLLSEPESLHPHLFRSTQANHALRDIGEGLVGYSPSGELVPLTAREWEISEDGLNYIFYLRENALWSNKDPVTAEHFVYAYQSLFDPSSASPSAGDATMIKNSSKVLAGELPPSQIGVVAVDAKTLSITLENPTPFFLQVLTHPSLFPIHPDSVAQHGKDFVRPGNYLSNGAYVLVEASATYGSLVYDRNIHYWDNEATFFDRVIYTTTVDQSQTNTFRAGEIEFTESIPVGSYDYMKKILPENVYVSTGFTTYYYGFNVTRPPFKDNPKLRQALSIAIDREIITEVITGRGEAPAFTLVPPGIQGYENPNYPFSELSKEDREKLAYEIYRQAGFSRDNPVKFELRYNTSEDHQKIALAVQSMWRNVLGAEVELVNEEFRVLISNIQDMRTTEAYRLSWSGDYLDPQSFLHLFETGNPNNLTGYSNPMFDSLLEQSKAELKSEKRLSLLREAERIALDDYPLVPIYYFVNKHMIADDIIGYEPNPLDVHYSKHFSRSSSK